MSFLPNFVLPGRRSFAVVFAIVCLLWLSKTDALSQSPVRLEIRILSSRPDLVSGGDALIEVKAPAGVSLSRITLTLNGKDVTDQLKEFENTGTFRGIVSGLGCW